MAVWTYEIATDISIPNVLVERGLADEVHKLYRVSAVDGYVLHDNRVDEPIYDEITGEPTGETVFRYATGTITVSKNYDFNTVVPDTITDVDGNTIAVNKIGAFELFAVPISAVPENNTYGVGNEHEIN